MKEAPSGVDPRDVLNTVRDVWSVPVNGVDHLPVGFGAHHWRLTNEAGPALFATLDALGPRHSLASLQAAYRGAALLADQGLEFVVAPLSPGAVAFGSGALSVTPWLAGSVVGEGPVVSPETDAAMLARLHSSPAREMPAWKPLVPSSFTKVLDARLEPLWDTGPFGPEARAALLTKRDAIAEWTNAYHRLAADAARRPWVPTHGEPHTRNQMRLVDGRLVLVDWESLKLAPRERDLGGLVEAGAASLVEPDPDMIAMFDLEWRVDEINQYSAWFAAPHTGTESDRVAYAGLLNELNRPVN